MAQRRRTRLNSWQTKIIAAAVVMSTASFTNVVQAQTIVIGGSGAVQVQVNMGAINPQPAFATPLNNLYQSNVGTSQNRDQYSTSSRIVYGNEVITLTPPGSRPKKKKIITAKKKQAKVKAKTKIATKAVAPKPVVVKSKPEVKVAKIAPPTKKITPKITATPPKVNVALKKEDAIVNPAPAVIRKEPAVSPTPKTVTVKPVVVAKSKKIVPVRTVETAAKTAPLKTTPPVESAVAAKKSEQEVQVAALTPETKTEPTAVKSGKANQIFFKPDQSKLPESATNKLKELVNTLKSSNERIQLFAYADAVSSSAARRLSLGRALVVRSKLMELGVPNNKIEVRALGKPKDGSPADRVDLNLILR